MKRVKYKWRQCIKNYRFHSIFLKNLTLIFILIVLPFICILGLSYYFYNHIQKSEEKIYKEELITRISMDVEGLFREIQNKAIMLSADFDVTNFYIAESIEKDYFYDVHNILKFLALYNLSTDVIDGVYVYAPYSKVVISEAGRYKYENFSDKMCIDSWDEEGEMFQIKYMDRKVAGVRKKTVAFYYTTNYSSGRKGVAIINMSLDKLEKVFAYNEGVSVYIVGNKQMIYDSTMENNGIIIDDSALLFDKTESVISSVKKLNVSDLELVIQIDRQSLDITLKSFRNYIIIFVGIMFMISILFALYVSRKIFDPFSEIMKALEESPVTEQGKMLQNKDEVSYIMNSIYATISKKQDVEEELLERIKLLKKAQSVALQAQINPHFINNTLETINWMAIGELGEENILSEMIINLSQLMRVSLEDSDTFVTLQDEIIYVKKYLYIQQKRLRNSFSVEFEGIEQYGNCKVIKMMLQPIVENAIEYGIVPYSRSGRLRISAIRNDDILSIIVQDSGLGISQEKVTEINNSIRKSVIKESSHIGLSNVHQRINLAFGDSYGIVVESRIGYGTKVTINLPYLNDRV